MDLVLPFGISNKKLFEESALKIGFDIFVARKFIYTNHESDIDVYPLMGDERISLLLYGWQLCEKYIQNNDGKLDEPVKIILKQLIYYSLNTWFSCEWTQCIYVRKAAMIYCLCRARAHYKNYKELNKLNWNYVLSLNTYPWSHTYTKKILSAAAAAATSMNNITDIIEDYEPHATIEDVEYMKQEGFVLIILRLVQLFNMNYIPAVLKLTMRTIIAWNSVQSRKQQGCLFSDNREITADDARCLQLICHIYLMAIYESDSTEGLIIDHMLNNIRFYYKSLAEKATPKAMKKLKRKTADFTAARHIALTCCYLHQPLNAFFESIVLNSFDECNTSVFGAVSQSYRSYILGNLLMELNALNEADFVKHFEHYKLLMDLYVDIRERSETFILSELRKLEKQVTSHNQPNTIDMKIDWKSKICKGNRFVTSDEDDGSACDESNLDRRIDPVFQNMPKNLDILDYTYSILAKRTYNGWHFAKLVLLLKIVSLKLNRVQSWRYHMGLTVDFVVNLERGLSSNFEDLAKIFHEYPFIEQELWLTAFNLWPKQCYFDAVSRCGLRFKRLHATKLNETKSEQKGPLNFLNAKYGLLSSTIDVKGMLHMFTHDAPNTDYQPLTEALRAIQLPEALIKDLLIVIFVPRHRNFSWAAQWSDLRRRCKDFLNNSALKRRCVELNMAEANNRLKYLKVDYQKYQHRPQLDYGSIEEGYEYAPGYAGYDTNSDDDDDEDFDYSESPNKSDEQKSPIKKPLLSDTSKNSQLIIPDSAFANTRRTRARVAAVIEAQNDAKSAAESEHSNESTTAPSSNSPNHAASKEIEADLSSESNASAKLLEEKLFTNATEGFHKFRDIWSKPQIERCQNGNQNDAPLPGFIAYQHNRLNVFDELADLNNENSSVEDSSESSEESDESDESDDEISFVQLGNSELNNVDGIDGASENTANINLPTDMSALTTMEGSPSLTEIDFGSFISTYSEDQDSDRSDYSTTARRDSEEFDDMPSSPPTAHELAEKDQNEPSTSAVAAKYAMEENQMETESNISLELFEEPRTETAVVQVQQISDIKTTQPIINFHAVDEINTEMADEPQATSDLESANENFSAMPLQSSGHMPEKQLSPAVTRSRKEANLKAIANSTIKPEQVIAPKPQLSALEILEHILPTLLITTSETSDQINTKSDIATAADTDTDTDTDPTKMIEEINTHDESGTSLSENNDHKNANDIPETTRTYIQTRDRSQKASIESQINVKTNIDLKQYGNSKAQKEQSKSQSRAHARSRNSDSIKNASDDDLAQPSSAEKLTNQIKEKIGRRSVRVRIKRSPSVLVVPHEKTDANAESEDTKLFKNLRSALPNIWKTDADADADADAVAVVEPTPNDSHNIIATDDTKDIEQDLDQNEEIINILADSCSEGTAKKRRLDRDARRRPKHDTTEQIKVSPPSQIKNKLDLPHATECDGDQLPKSEEAVERGISKALGLLKSMNTEMLVNMESECLERQSSVKMTGLYIKDVLLLKQPKVRVKRLKKWNMQLNKHKADIVNPVTAPVSNLCPDDEDGSQTTNSRGSSLITTASSNNTRSRRAKRNFTTSESSLENVHRKRSRPKRYSRKNDSTGTDSNSNSPTPRSVKKLIVTPRSASGLKLRISSVSNENINNQATTKRKTFSSTPAQQRKQRTRLPNLIEISDTEYNTDEEDVVIVDADSSTSNHPLYEEEISC